MRLRALFGAALLTIPAILHAQSAGVENAILGAALKEHLGRTQVYIRGPVVVAAATAALPPRTVHVWTDAARAAFDARNVLEPLAVVLPDLTARIVVADVAAYERGEGFDWNGFSTANPGKALVRFARPALVTDDTAVVRLELTMTDGRVAESAYVLSRGDGEWRVSGGQALAGTPTPAAD